MLNLIQGELYRFFHKKSMYIYFGILGLGYFFVIFMRSGGFDEGSVAVDATTLFEIFPVLIGGFLFATIYTDDLNSKSLITLVGYGMSKSQIVMAKFLLVTWLGMLLFAMGPLYHIAIYALFGYVATGQQIGMIYAFTLTVLLRTLAYCAIGGIAVYGLQRPTFSFVTYILFAFSIVKTIITLLIGILKLEVDGYLLSNVIDQIMIGMIIGEGLAESVIKYLVYLIVALLLSAIAFNKKEMEF